MNLLIQFYILLFGTMILSINFAVYFFIFQVAVVLVFLMAAVMAHSPYDGNWRGTYGPYGDDKGSSRYDTAPYGYEKKDSYGNDSPSYGYEKKGSYGYNAPPYGYDKKMSYGYEALSHRYDNYEKPKSFGNYPSTY